MVERFDAVDVIRTKRDGGLLSDEQIDACYHPAPESAPEARRRARVAQLVLQRDGKRLRSADPGAYLQGTGAMLMFEVGKARAGRLLDGREHNGMP